MPFRSLSLRLRLGTANVTITSPVVVGTSGTVAVVAGVGNTATNPTLRPGHTRSASLLQRTRLKYEQSDLYNCRWARECNHDNHHGQPDHARRQRRRHSRRITVQAKDANGNNLTTSGGAVTLHPTVGAIGAVTDHNNGTYTATFTSPTTTGTATITGTIGGNPITPSPTHCAHPRAGRVLPRRRSRLARPPWSPTESRPRRSRSRPRTRTATTSTASGGAVTLHPTVGTIGTVTDNTNGTYTATFTSPTTTGTATITGTIGGNAITPSPRLHSPRAGECYHDDDRG